MPTNNFIVTSLPAYVQENRDILLKNFGLVGGTIRNRIGIQTGIKSSENLNYLDVSPTSRTEASASWTPRVTSPSPTAR